jgi:hypothetical protein
MKTSAPFKSRTTRHSCSIANTTVVIAVVLVIMIGDAFAGTPGSNECSMAVNSRVADCCDGVVVGDEIHAKLVNGRIYTSVNGSVWTERPLSFGTFLRAMTYGNGLFVAVGGSYFDEPGVIVTSRDGVTWTRRNRSNEKNLYGVTFGNGLFVAVGDAGIICTSAEGLAWKRQRSGISARLLAAVASGNGIFVAGGESGAIVTSTNGVHWTLASLNAPVYVGKIRFRDGAFIVNDHAATFMSSDGLTWTRSSPQITDLLPFAFPNNTSASSPPAHQHRARGEPHGYERD